MTIRTKRNIAESTALSTSLPMTRDVVGDIRSIVAEARREVVRQLSWSHHRWMYAIKGGAAP